MIKMMILGWSGTRLQRVINDENSSFFYQERDKALAVLRSYGAVHVNTEWRNMLWDNPSGRLVVIDLEDVEWLKRPRPLQPTSANKRGGQGEISKSGCPVHPLSTHDTYYGTADIMIEIFIW